MTDFGADHSFSKAVEKLQEHYRVEVPASAVRLFTQHHGQLMANRELETKLPGGGVGQLIAEMDGSLVPIVTPGGAECVDFTADRRKVRRLEWREARLVMVRRPELMSKLYSATLKGVEEAGEHLLNRVIEAGGGQKTKIHCLGDGALWIEGQVKKRLAHRASYLIDFYHVSEYLAKAAIAIEGREAGEWLREQKERMKENRVEEVLKELEEGLGKQEEEEGREAVKGCERYLNNRIEYLDYKGAREAGLPIGTGEVESGHRSVIQARLKIAGAWWKVENAEKMLGLRATRASGEWQAYWDELRQAAA